MSFHPSHVTRYSDSSFYDEICIHCGATDRLGSWGELAKPCPVKKELKSDPLMTQYSGVYLMNDGSVKQGDWYFSRRRVDDMVKTEHWFGAKKLLYILKKMEK